MYKVIVGLVTGLLFGLGMNISQMVDPNKVLNFLDIFGAWDPSLAFVIGGALLVFIPFYHLIIKPRRLAINGDEYRCVSVKQAITGRLVVGSVLFGIGWGMVGICPGPAVAGLLRGDMMIYWFIASMLFGHYASQWIFAKT
ncbi:MULTISPECIES: DUF6691 family protein [unclassified Agarivorans]|uniref:DUF6691 family protein n=1 Tax=unclassified Agarivorans TaxID=2636026 RepID=UPI003D7DF68F